MNKMIIRLGLFLTLTAFVSCSSGSGDKERVENVIAEGREIALNSTLYGADISEENAMLVEELERVLNGKDSAYVKVRGRVTDVCQKKGCWMKLETGETENDRLMVTFKDYAFFVPKDAAEKTAVIEGIAKRELTSVETLRHYAEDAGKIAEEINAITQPEEKITFEAVGVILQ